MLLKHVLGIFTFLIFLLCFHLGKDKKKTYLVSVLCLFPFVDLHITNEYFGSVSVFDGMSYYVLLYFFKDFISGLKPGLVYFCLFCALCVILFIGSLQSEFPANSLISAIKYVSVFVYAKILIDECFEYPQFPGRVVKYLKIICSFSIIFLGIQMLVGLDFTFYPDLNPNTHVEMIRYPSFFRDAQIISQFLAMCSFLFLISEPDDKRLVVFSNWVFFVITIAALLLTGGRAGFAGLCAGFLILFISGKRNFQLFIVSCCLVGYLLVTYMPQSFVIFNREEGVSDSYEVRMRIWKEALRVFKTSPVLGIGVGNYPVYAIKHANTGYFIVDKEVVFYGTESGYLKILAESGVLGITVILSLIFLPIINTVRTYLKERVNYNVFFLLAAIFAWITSFFTSNTFDDKRVMVLLATLLCLLISAQKSGKEIYE